MPPSSPKTHPFLLFDTQCIFRRGFLKPSLMIPVPDCQSPEPVLLKKMKNPLLTLLNFVTIHPRTWLILLIFSLQLLLLLLARSLPVASHHNFPAAPMAPAPPTTPSTSTCPSGKVFVYDLPSPLNRQLTDECDSLDPWNSRCPALSNDGFGPFAVGVQGLVPETLNSSWFSTDQFTAEIIYHNRVLHHPYRTSDPSSATAFYIPFYGGLVVGKYLWSSNYTAKDCDFLCKTLLEWLDQQETWRRSNGWNHFMVLGRIVYSQGNQGKMATGGEGDRAPKRLAVEEEGELGNGDGDGGELEGREDAAGGDDCARRCRRGQDVRARKISRHLNQRPRFNLARE